MHKLITVEKYSMLKFNVIIFFELNIKFKDKQERLLDFFILNDIKTTFRVNKQTNT